MKSSYWESRFLPQPCFWANCVGLCFLWPSLILSTYHMAMASASSSLLIDESIIDGAFVGACAVMALLLIVRGDWFLQGERYRLVCLGGGMAGLAGHIALAFFGSVVPAFIVVGAICCIAFYTALFLFAFMRVLCIGSAEEGVLCVALSFVGWEAVWLLFDAFGASGLLCMVLAPVLVVLCAFVAPGLCEVQKSCEVAVSAREKCDVGLGRSLWSLVAASAVFVSFNVFFVNILFLQELNDLETPHTVAAVTSLIAIGAMLGLLMRQSFSGTAMIGVFSILLILYMGALVVILLSGGESNAVVNRSWSACGRCFKVLALMSLAALVSIGTVGSSRAAGIFVLVFIALPRFVSSSLMYDLVEPGALANTQVASTIATVGIFVIAAAAIAYLYGTLARMSAWKKPPVPTDSPLSDPREILARYGLTNRELDVTELAYRGYSAKRIGDDLFLAESTVRGHLMRAYRKLDVHTKQELIDFVEHNA